MRVVPVAFLIILSNLTPSTSFGCTIDYEAPNSDNLPFFDNSKIRAFLRVFSDAKAIGIAAVTAGTRARASDICETKMDIRLKVIRPIKGALSSAVLNKIETVWGYHDAPKQGELYLVWLTQDRSFLELIFPFLADIQIEKLKHRRFPEPHQMKAIADYKQRDSGFFFGLYSTLNSESLKPTEACLSVPNSSEAAKCVVGLGPDFQEGFEFFTFRNEASEGLKQCIRVGPFLPSRTFQICLYEVLARFTLADQASAGRKCEEILNQLKEFKNLELPESYCQKAIASLGKFFRMIEQR